MYLLTRNATIVMWIFDHLGLILWILLGILVLIGVLMSIFSNSSPHNRPLTLEEQESLKRNLEKVGESNDQQKNKHVPAPVVILDKGQQGEAIVLEAVQKSHPDVKHLSSLYVPTGDEHYTEVDLIAIHSTGIYVIESKNYRGVIVGNEDERIWNRAFIDERNEFYNPIMQNTGHIRAIRRFLGERYKGIPFHSILVFNNDSNLDMIKVKSKGIIITKHKDLTSQLQGLFHILPDVLNTEITIEIYEILRPQTEVSEDIKMKHLEYVQHRKDAE
ncbi:NERD domain-containing protein [Paenibacillus vortex V453]|uniref:NERD domain-containing protein n=1 Tax=Paenibacillus vortex V453 TaxID=715225 RepID=A0A2R9T1F2_9BACL|nr:NERD domain-containing protein [Paenibacillus vortex V453]